MKVAITSELISPCGMNCAICASYLSEKNDIRSKGVKLPYCVGCKPRNKNCAFLKKGCARLSRGEFSFCFECANFPCDNLVALDSRYKSRYRMSMIENLNFIREYGIEKFIEKQENIWKCEVCGELLRCYNGLCFNCDLEKIRNKKQKYRWDNIDSSM